MKNQTILITQASHYSLQTQFGTITFVNDQNYNVGITLKPKSIVIKKFPRKYK